MAKVYCSNCSNLSYVGGGGGYVCSKASVVTEDDWFQTRSIPEPPSEKNASNNCQDFKAKTS